MSTLEQPGSDVIRLKSRPPWPGKTVGSQPRWVIEEYGFQAKLLSEVLAYRLHAPGLGGVMTGEHQHAPPFRSIVIQIA